MHWSKLHSFPSSQLVGGPGMQFPALHTSPSVQALPSLHDPVKMVRRQLPLAGSQESDVQGFRSSQLLGGWAQAPLDGSHWSVVHGLPSSQFLGVPWH